MTTSPASAQPCRFRHAQPGPELRRIGAPQSSGGEHEQRVELRPALPALLGELGGQVVVPDQGPHGAGEGRRGTPGQQEQQDCHAKQG